MKILLKWLSLTLVSSLLASSLCYAADMSLAPPDDPRQSITYWKSHTITADQDPLVAASQDVFSVLLRAWDSSRLEPGLYVVDSAAGPWAASLADGNILLSHDAIKTCMSFGQDRGEHLLAFVLAHELAHQRSDDLWHQRFFRMIGNKKPANKQKMMQGLQLDSHMLSDLEQKEAQADHDGLILMSSVGYDPYQILDKKDFFTAWVESIWSDRCQQGQTEKQLIEACKQAQIRALRTRAQLSTVATQAMLYELGVQAFVAQDYPQARQYFTAYGRDYPSRAVLSSLGLTYLAEAKENHNWLVEQGLLDQPAFYYPLILDATANARPQKAQISSSQKRSDLKSIALKKQKQLAKAIGQSIHYFEKAIRLEPAHRKTYLLLATAHLLENNTYMVRGVLQGRYIPKFGHDVSADMILALTSAIEGNSKKADKEFMQLLDKLSSHTVESAIPVNLLIYSVYFNNAAYAIYSGKHAKAQQLWKQLANKAQTTGNTLLFRLALGHIVQQNNTGHQVLSKAPNVNGLRLGDRTNIDKQSSSVSDLWIDGEQHKVYRLTNGSRFIVGPDRKIISAWQEMGQASLGNAITAGDSADRPFKTLGLPDRHLDMTSGEYLAYDKYGLALHINNNKVLGWFLYTTQ